jgi:predicted transcriptional regulator
LIEYFKIGWYEKMAQKINEKVNVEMVMDAIVKNYAIVTPNVICTVFGFEDGGKLLRRHLRAKFATDCNHVYRQNWVFKNDDTQLKSIIQYGMNLWTVCDTFIAEYGLIKIE